jgi:hypothetical protein
MYDAEAAYAEHGRQKSRMAIWIQRRFIVSILIEDPNGRGCCKPKGLKQAWRHGT